MNEDHYEMLKKLNAMKVLVGLDLDAMAQAYGVARGRDSLFFKETNIHLAGRVERVIRGWKNEKSEFFVGNLSITADRWPWQGYGWFPHRNPEQRKNAAPLNMNGARFGGGWAWELGFRAGDFRSKYGWTVIVGLLFGTIRINYTRKP